MKIYFSASLREREKLLPQYKLIVEFLKSKSDVIYKHILNIDGQVLNYNEYFLKKIKEANFLVVDVTASSIGVGQEISSALSKRIPVLALQNSDVNNRKHPSLISVKDRLFKYVIYNSTDELKTKINKFLSFSIKQNLTIRFNLMISKEIESFLRSQAAKNNIGMSEYLRTLIERQMQG